MRDLIDVITNLTESTGLAGRKPGDIFKNDQGDEMTFSEINFFPEEGGKYTREELDSALQNIQSQVPNIEWQNARSSRTGGFGVVTFDREGTPVYIGRYFNEINPNMAENYISNTVGDFKYGGKAAQKAQSGVSPQDLLDKKDNLTPNDVLKQLANSLGTKSPLYEVAYKVANGSPFPIKFAPPPGITFPAFRDYFCEILQPLALIAGNYTGNAGDAAEKFLNGSFDDTTITFDETKTAGLSDSILYNSEGKYVKISTKGGKGAEASTKNLMDSIKELEVTSIGNKLLKTYKDVVTLLKNVTEAGQIDAPLMLGIKYDIITPEDAAKIKSFRKAPPVNLKNINSLKLSPQLKKIALSRTPEDTERVNMFYHLIAAIAHLAAEKVNTTTNFSKAAADILNNGALVQVYTEAKETKNEWSLNNFNTIYPGESITGVYFSAGKNYFSKGIKGNFTFKIDKGKGKPPKESNKDPSYGGKKPTEVDITKAAKKIVTKKSKSLTSKKPAKDVGRAKRKQTKRNS